MKGLDQKTFFVTNPLVTLDLGITQAASSFFSPYGIKRDPRARTAFERIATYYCNRGVLNFSRPIN